MSCRRPRANEGPAPFAAGLAHSEIAATLFLGQENVKALVSRALAEPGRALAEPGPRDRDRVRAAAYDYASRRGLVT
ncbi:hypothetical protein VM636_00255 [Streptomyces sp. SCSIO 75703]|uniref:hypothetical protein n=1 Tax=unclassified Streptomyces TaxID=2593676 RepID=UPI0006B659A8|nr:hypothetical protein [Streptomyces sp. TP-A0875]